MVTLAILLTLLAPPSDPPALDGTIHCLAYARDGSVLIAGGDNGDLRVWDARSGQLVRRFRGHKEEVVALAVTADGRSLVSSGFEWEVKLWDLGDPGRPPKPLESQEDLNHAVVFSPDGKVIATGGTAGVVRLRDGAGKVLRSMDAGEDRFPDVNEGEFNQVNTVVFSHDGTRLAAGADSGLISVWEPATGKLLAKLRGHRSHAFEPDAEHGCVNALAFSPDDRILASSGDDGTVRLWDPRAGRALKALPPPPELPDSFGPEDRAGMVAFSPDGSVIAAVLYTGPIRLWDVKTGRAIRMLADAGLHARAIAFSPDGAVLATGNIEGLRFWDWSRGRLTADGGRSPR